MTDQPELQDVLDAQVKMQATLDAILAKFENVAGDIKPMIDQLASHPLMKMLGVKK